MCICNYILFCNITLGPRPETLKPQAPQSHMFMRYVAVMYIEVIA